MSDFVDHAQLHARAGNGGAGAVAFRREPFVDKGGPDGGDGGDGGSVWLRATTGLVSLIGFRDHPFRRADDGGHGSGQRRNGANGKDIVVDVPVGTVVRDMNGELLFDLAEEGLRICVGRGGRGGKGNAGFLSNKRRAPAFADQGEVGEEQWFNLELKLKADVALIGFPNVGKSSLISVISRARPKVANYPFTTLIPSLGVVRVGGGEDGSEYVVADIPGLIEGASSGRGLGLEFLRHVERSKVMAIVVDLSEEQGSIFQQATVLVNELRNYLPALLERPRVLIANKVDLVVDAPDLSGELVKIANAIGAIETVVTSTSTRENLEEVKRTLHRVLMREGEEYREIPSSEVVVHRLRPRFEVSVEKVDDGVFVVTGRDALHAVRLSDLESFEALSIVHERLDRLGVLRSLRRLGVREGDVVSVGDLTFTYEERQ
ncbi:MAG: GTPase ObgE [Acidimicrobiales bacterium]